MTCWLIWQKQPGGQLYEGGNFMRVLIITGGTSSERRISLISAKAVKKGLEQAGYKTRLFDLKQRNKLKDLVKKFDIIFPVIHGEEGEGGRLQQYLSTLGKPFVGGDPEGFKTGWYKIPFKRFCKQNNIPTSPWRKIKNKDDIIRFGFPCVLKSSSGGSSREVIILKSAQDLVSKTCQHLLKLNSDLFVERYLPGVEVTVAILENKALPVIEIIPPQGGWFDYENKYSGATEEIVGAPSLDDGTRKKVQQIAQKIHQTLNLGPYSRIDFIVSNSHPYALEVNTIPGFTAQSLFPKAAQAIGLSFPALLDKMIKIAYKNQKRYN